MAEKGRVFVGARARLLIKGVKVGYARNCSGGESIDYEEVNGLDNIEVLEYAATKYRVRFSAGFVRLVGETAKTLGHFPRVGQNPDEHLSNILTSGELTITIEDNVTGNLIMTLEQAKASSNNFNIDAVGVVGRDMEFNAIRMRDESEV